MSEKRRRFWSHLLLTGSQIRWSGQCHFQRLRLPYLTLRGRRVTD